MNVQTPSCAVLKTLLPPLAFLIWNSSSPGPSDVHKCYGFKLKYKDMPDEVIHKIKLTTNIEDINDI